MSFLYPRAQKTPNAIVFFFFFFSLSPLAAYAACWPIYRVSYLIFVLFFSLPSPLPICSPTPCEDSEN